MCGGVQVYLFLHLGEGLATVFSVVEVIVTEKSGMVLKDLVQGQQTKVSEAS